MPRYIDADALEKAVERYFNGLPIQGRDDILAIIANAPTADVQEVKRGEWTEKEVIHRDEAKNIIEEWQSCRCSVCDRYDTRPYMYYFDKPNFCSWCGADMRERREDAPTADVVEVVRCKNCKHREGSACDYSAVWVRDNGFCQWGERREDA